MLTLLREIGLGERLAHRRRPARRSTPGARLLSLPPGTVMGVPASADSVSGVLSEKGLRAVEAEPSLPELRLAGGDVALGPLLRERFGDELVDRLVDPLLGGVYAGEADGLGLRATMPGLASAIASGAGSLTAAAASQLPAASGKPGTAPVFRHSDRRAGHGHRPARRAVRRRDPYRLAGACAEPSRRGLAARDRRGALAVHDQPG